MLRLREDDKVVTEDDVVDDDACVVDPEDVKLLIRSSTSCRPSPSSSFCSCSA